MELIQLYQQTIDKWGTEAQYDQMVEECAELIAALKHYRRGKVDQQAVISELADVTLMVGQLTWMLGTKQVDLEIKNKRGKLEKLLQSAE